MPDDVRTDLRALLDAVESAPPVEAVEVLGHELTRMVGAADVEFLIADFSGDALIRFPPPGQPHVRVADDDLVRMTLAGSPHEQALRSQEVLVEAVEGGASRLFAPVTDRGDAIGVLELVLPAGADRDTITFVASAAHALAYVVIASRRHTDLFERGQRNQPFSLSAEIQRRLLPPAFTCEGAEFTIAGWLEPASTVGGDTFDYSVERDALHVSISDAMGHAVEAAQLATLAVGSLRNSRRTFGSVVDQAVAANEAIDAWECEPGFVTALLLRIELATGRVSTVNAGHELPYLLRDGVVTGLNLEADLPLGLFGDAEFREQTLTLQPGDRLALVTDGMLERNAASIDIGTAMTDLAELHPRELVHAFARAVIGATGGKLQDDATVVCLDWYGPQGGGGGRVARAGASQERASASGGAAR